MTSELAQTILDKFVQRHSAFAIQTDKGAYRPSAVYQCPHCPTKSQWATCRQHGGGENELIGYVPLDAARVQKHIDAEATYGHYIVDTDNTCRVLGFDIDLVKEVERGGVTINPRDIFFDKSHPLQGEIKERFTQVIHGLMERSRRISESQVVATFSGNKGFHVYVLMPEPTVAGQVRALGHQILEGAFEATRGDNFFKHTGWGTTSYDEIEIEMFPKQDTVGSDGFGNLMRLPLGTHQKSGRSGFFLDPTFPNASIKPADPLAVLAGK